MACPASLSGLLAPICVGYIVDHVNFNPPTVDCFTGHSTTAKDYRVPFTIASGCFLLLIVFIVFFLDVKVEKQDRKLTLKQEFGWVSLGSFQPSPCR